MIYPYISLFALPGWPSCLLGRLTERRGVSAWQQTVPDMHQAVVASIVSRATTPSHPVSVGC